MSTPGAPASAPRPALRPGAARPVTGPGAPGSSSLTSPAGDPTGQDTPSTRPAAAGDTTPQPQIRGEMRLSGESIELAELVQFRERLEQITRGLVDEYSRILALRPSAGSDDSSSRS